MPDFFQGVAYPWQDAAAYPVEVQTIIDQWYLNRTPLITMLKRVPVGSSIVRLAGRRRRPRDYNITVNILVGDTTLTLADVTPLRQGDVLEIPYGGEQVEITADPNVTNNTITVIRAQGGTTAAAATAPITARLVANSRTGGEIDQKGIERQAYQNTQFTQVFQHTVEASGRAQSEKNFVTTRVGVNTPLDQYRMDALDDLTEDMESSCLFQRGMAPGGTWPTYGTSPAPVSPTNRAKQYGLKWLIDPGNVIAPGFAKATPTNAAAYTPANFETDVLMPILNNGGNPSLIICSIGALTAFTVWGWTLQKLDPGPTDLGVTPTMYYSPYAASGATIIPHWLLKGNTFAAFTEDDLAWGTKRDAFWNPHGVRGDKASGDFIAEGAILLEQPLRHSWVEGITTFAKP